MGTQDKKFPKGRKHVDHELKEIFLMHFRWGKYKNFSNMCENDEINDLGWGPAHEVSGDWDETCVFGEELWAVAGMWLELCSGALTICSCSAAEKANILRDSDLNTAGQKAKTATNWWNMIFLNYCNTWSHTPDKYILFNFIVNLCILVILNYQRIKIYFCKYSRRKSLNNIRYDIIP
jgi:hypothetical protein